MVAQIASTATLIENGVSCDDPAAETPGRKVTGFTKSRMHVRA